MEKLSKDQEEAVLRVFQASLTPLKFKEHLREKGLIEECFKSGWYNNRFGLAYFDEKKKGLYGFHNGEWGLKCMIYFCNKGLIKPIHLVVESALIKEAKKRGFKDGVEVKECLLYPDYKQDDNKIIGIFTFDCIGNELHLRDEQGLSIFNNGKWAEITEQKKTINVDGVIYKEV